MSPSAETLALVKYNEAGARRRARIRKLRRLYAECDDRVGQISGLTGFAELEGAGPGNTGSREICESDREAMVAQLDAQMAAYRSEWERLEAEDQAAAAEFARAYPLDGEPSGLMQVWADGVLRTGKIPMDSALKSQLELEGKDVG